MTEENETKPKPNPKPIDWNKLISKEKRRAFYAGRIHTYKEIVNTYYPIMSNELLECVVHQLDELTNTKREIALEQSEAIEGVQTFPQIPNSVPNPFNKHPLSGLPFMKEEPREPEERAKLDDALGVRK